MYDSLIQQFQNKLKFAPQFKKTVRFVIKDDDKIIRVDCSERPATVTYDDDSDTDVTMIATLDTFSGIMDGSKDPTMAFMSRKLKIKGSIGIAMQLNAILED